MSGFGSGFKKVYRTSFGGFGAMRIGQKYSEPKERVDLFKELLDLGTHLEIVVPSPFGPQRLYFDHDVLETMKSATSVRIFDANADIRKKRTKDLGGRPLKLYCQLLWAEDSRITRHVYLHRLAMGAEHMGPTWHVHHLDDVAISTLDCRKSSLQLLSASEHGKVTAAHNKLLKQQALAGVAG